MAPVPDQPPPRPEFGLEEGRAYCLLGWEFDHPAFVVIGLAE
jgi:hypothetical protein